MPAAPRPVEVTALVPAPRYPDAQAAEIVSLVLDAVDSPHTRRAYARALSDFLEWHAAAGRPPLVKATVQRYRTYLRDTLGLSASTINQRLSAIRKLALEAADNDLVDPAAANGIRAVKGVRQEGHRAGNWLSVEDAQKLLNAPDVSTVKGLRDRAILAVLLGCGLRRMEVARLTWQHIQKREGRWVIIDMVGKRNKIRSVPLPAWCKQALDAWQAAAGAALAVDQAGPGPVFPAVLKGGHLGPQARSMTPQAIRNLVAGYSARLGLGDIAPHDLRRTFAKLSHKGGAGLDQIQLSLGHASIKTTEIYLGIDQSFTNAPCDHLELSLIQ